VAAGARHQDACATGNGGNGWIATWVRNRTLSASKILGGTLDRDAEIFVSLIARSLRLLHTQPSRDLALGDALRKREVMSK
jgi:hypothetical protein